MEEEEPAAGEERRCDERLASAGETAAERGEQGKAREGEHRRHQPQPAQPEPEMGDHPGDEEVERRAATLAGDVLDHPGEAVAPDEQRERLVLVRRPGHQLVQQESRGPGYRPG